MAQHANNVLAKILALIHNILYTLTYCLHIVFFILYHGVYMVLKTYITVTDKVFYQYIETKLKEIEIEYNKLLSLGNC